MRWRIPLWMILVGGCGPLVVPMPSRLEPAEQSRIDRGWEKALTPVDGLDREAWLDLLVGVSLFEEGVDKLDFRSEKKFSKGTVVMQIRFDRAQPSADEFSLEIRSVDGKLLRREVYTRDDVMRSAHALFRQEADESAEARSERGKRWATIHGYFPEKSEGDAGVDADPP